MDTFSVDFQSAFMVYRSFMVQIFIVGDIAFLVLFYRKENRTLSTSDDVEDRENEKGRLEEAYEKCDRDLDELIVQHYTELTTAIRTYQSITERITTSRNKIKQDELTVGGHRIIVLEALAVCFEGHSFNSFSHNSANTPLWPRGCTDHLKCAACAVDRFGTSLDCTCPVKENLLSCKMLLHCKRDELRKLWIEGIEHKHVLNLLDEIENIKQVPQKLEQCMASKHYLSATDMLGCLEEQGLKPPEVVFWQFGGLGGSCLVTWALSRCQIPRPASFVHNQRFLVSAVESLEGPLLQVEGLSDLRLELHSKKMNLHLVLIDELHRHLYIKSTSRVVQRNKEKGRVSSLIKDTSPVPLIDVTNLPTPRKFLDTSQYSTPGSSSAREINLQDIKEDLESDPEENSTLFMGILIKGLAKLKKIPETVKAIKERLEQELQQIVKRSTTQVADSGYQRGENLTVENQPRVLVAVVIVLFPLLLQPSSFRALFNYTSFSHQPHAEDPRLLLELLELLFDKFNAVATAHSVVLGYLQDTVVAPLTQQEDVKLYDMADVWVKIQDVLQVRCFYRAWQNMATVGPYVEWQFQTWPGAWKCWSSESPEWGELAEHPELSDVASESLCCGKRTVWAAGLPSNIRLYTHQKLGMQRQTHKRTDAAKHKKAVGTVIGGQIVEWDPHAVQLGPIIPAYPVLVRRHPRCRVGHKCATTTDTWVEVPSRASAAIKDFRRDEFQGFLEELACLGMSTEAKRR
ncbi:hypothetical protein PANDA_011664 [Ailuropoda melanoleuca]|uniref:Exocyst complex component Sec8 n=1 Tax=Ailuropoda melanoleuca TaxID=9646 RepID=D2HJZ4_AILME|nr:hypothetical protein PANDA_011664 [Ailuropoda melanoleuca]